MPRVLGAGTYRRLARAQAGRSSGGVCALRVGQLEQMVVADWPDKLAHQAQEFHRPHTSRTVSLIRLETESESQVINSLSLSLAG